MLFIIRYLGALVSIGAYHIVLPVQKFPQTVTTTMIIDETQTSPAIDMISGRIGVVTNITYIYNTWIITI